MSQSSYCPAIEMTESSDYRAMVFLGLVFTSGGCLFPRLEKAHQGLGLEIRQSQVLAF